MHYNTRNDWGLIELLPKEIKQELEVITGDVQDPFMVRKAVQGCDAVFHLAALIAIPYSYIAPESYVNTLYQSTVLMIVLGLVVVHCFGVGNFGTGIRHRMKFVGGLMVLAGPMLPFLSWRKNGALPFVQRPDMAQWR